MTNRPQIHASTVGEAVKSTARYIESEIFMGRGVRVGFSEKRISSEFGPRLVHAYIVVQHDTRNVHNYPLSIAGWALAESRIIAWPQERSVQCNFDRIRELDKLDGLDQLVEDDRFINAPPYLARTVDVGLLKRAFAKRQLTLDTFYQDWSSWSPSARYSQFISVPVPLLTSAPGPLALDEFGVFNIDSFESVPLLNDTTETLLGYAAEVVADAYRRLRSQKPTD